MRALSPGSPEDILGSPGIPQPRDPVVAFWRACDHLVAPTLPHPPPGLPNPPLCSSVNDKSWSPTSCPHLGTSPCSPFLPQLRLGSKHQVFNWLRRRRCCCCFSGSGCTGGEPSPCPPQGSSSRPLRTFLACYSHAPLFCPCGQPPHREGRPFEGVLRLPYGDSSTFEVSVLGNICGLQGPSQVWGSPSPYDQCWGIPWEPRF